MSNFKRFLGLLAIFFVGGLSAFCQYYTISLDTQQPSEQPVIDRLFSGNNTYLRAYIFEDGVALDLTGWTMTFRYGWGRDDTNGMVTITGTTSSNRVDFLSATNVYAEPYDSYYWSISGISGGYVKTFGTGTLRVFYDPATSTNLFAMMSQVNIDWMTNSIFNQVVSNQVRIAVFETGKVDLVTFKATNLLFEGRISTNTTNIAELRGRTNTWNDVTNKAGESAVVALSNQLFLADGVLQTNINLSSNAWYTTHTAYVAQVEGATNDIISQLTTAETNQAATNILLQAGIDAVGTGTWSMALLTDGSRPGAYLNIANTNYLGNELITNGTFTGSASNWSLTT
ncbi:MAG: hypothetical protein WC451_05205, partial [Patescibacteria group bacterium]